MDELLAVAMAMEMDAVRQYAAMAARMRATGRADLAEVFDRLVREESEHVDVIARWPRQAASGPRQPPPAANVPPGVFDDEALAMVSPELMDAYRSFAVAVRNEERAFAFWSYVAAQGTSPEIRKTAETMAQEELAHAKTLRRERRKAFFRDRHPGPPGHQALDLARLEMDVSTRLEGHTGPNGDKTGQKAAYRDLALEARMIARDLAANPFPDFAPARQPPQALDALCEWLADYYIDAGDHLPSQAARDRAQALATLAVKRLAIVRFLEER